MVIKNEKGEVLFVTDKIFKPGDILRIDMTVYTVLRVEDKIAIVSDSLKDGIKCPS